MSINRYIEDWNLAENVIFTVFSRAFYSFGLLALIYPALLGHANWIYKILSH